VPAAPSSAEEVIAQSLESFRGYPAFRGTLVLHSVEGDFTYRMWVREPRLRVDLDIDGEPVGTWVSDGETTNIREPHVHAFAFTATDPRGPALFDCDHVSFAGVEQVAGRSVTGVSCRSASETNTYWIDVETGMILAGEQRSPNPRSWWEFTDFRLDPEIPPELFDVPK
jgi:hypothetical protein